MVDRIDLEEAKRNFSDVLKLVANAKQRIVIAHEGKDLGALIPLEDFALLERLDGDVDVPVEHVVAAEVMRHLEEDLVVVSSEAERIVVRESGKDVACLVPPRDLSVLQNLDDRLDIEAAKRLLQKELDDDA